ncbi:CDP-diacylglycerol-glycerol-3-phosphate 3-phosphatidyltransferase [Trichosporon asahii var. asahii CBS 2479]|uniref:CDP-diacylglycerol--glycerol-3-phosphate 3-phosphatidyltransferase n=1 Tax=Trichosporon asahii var. asahii (strain ATCC 90039 / CBS 2479 / JCM 2466 / KCTC 7840 / NBRC 103889/ NCYC 2677 / UAMH 7654) TaxID=1186058 RepID=J6F1F3_TRIAS|nr:CDP-diacylglycerol-glycerol-3-phosphate 3-phosphatidyltransferase [Trichosporon asahii var. asahii CBS 2479]EJT48977.1 CDP-diacylglycerol-glycerol-3-phosphate 3-phosphatidyltransferase [Trichosporon asahii var. asahii CBS 2479]
MSTSSRPLRPLRQLAEGSLRRVSAPPPRPPPSRLLHSSRASAVAASTKASEIVQLPHSHGAFAELANTLSSTQPCFATHGDEVALLPSPTAFHSELLSMVANAKRRILISTLYIGTEEASLVDAVATALRANSQLKCTFMLDYNRSTRLGKDEPKSTVHMLLPLIREFGDRAEVWLYRSPKLRGPLERIVPPRYNEGFGTWHAKYYCADSDVLISGANLAKSYFTNRQDRYVRLSGAPIVSYLGSLTRLLTDYAYRVTLSRAAEDPQLVVKLPEDSEDVRLVWRQRSLPPRGWGAHAHATLTAFQQAWKASNAVRTASGAENGADTFFWPVLQAGYLGLREEERAMAAAWGAINAARDVDVDLTSGYFGLYAAYKRAVLESNAPVSVIAAAPESNGFYKSKGPSGLIPEGYTLLERRFWAEAERKGRASREQEGGRHEGIVLKEWKKQGWTYHAKGLWVSPEHDAPFLSFIGSSNLSTRSLNLDTELSLFLGTRNESLRRALGNEVAHLNANSHVVDAKTFALPERRVSLAAKVLVALGVEGML